MTENQILDFNSLVADFEAGRLSKEQWTHEAHLAVGFYCAAHYKTVTAVNRMKRMIIHHNERVGTPNSDTEGYHETITRFWIELIHRFLKIRNQDVKTAYKEFLQTHWSKRDIILKYYSPQYLFSAKARREFVEPDLKSFNNPIPNINQ